MVNNKIRENCKSHVKRQLNCNNRYSRPLPKYIGILKRIKTKILESYTTITLDTIATITAISLSSLIQLKTRKNQVQYADCVLKTHFCDLQPKKKLAERKCSLMMNWVEFWSCASRRWNEIYDCLSGCIHTRCCTLVPINWSWVLNQNGERPAPILICLSKVSPSSHATTRRQNYGKVQHVVCSANWKLETVCRITT